MTGETAIGILVALAIFAGLGAAGYSIGSSAAPSDSDAQSGRKDAFRAAYASSVSQARARARRDGHAKGLTRGREAARHMGGRAGRTAGTAQADKQVAAAQTQEIPTTPASSDPCAPGNGNGNNNVPGSYISPSLGYCVPPNGLEPEG